MSDTKKTLAQRLVSAMRSIDAVTKSGRNEKQGYSYVKAADVANEVRRVMCAEGIAFTYSVTDSKRWEKPTNSGGSLFFCELNVLYRFIDQDSGETLEVMGLGWGADTLDKAPYKAMTGALKYALRMNFLIPDEEDPERANELYEEMDQRSRPQSKPQPIRAPQKMRDEDDVPIFDEDGDLVEHPSAVQNRQQQAAQPPRAAAGMISEKQRARLWAIAKQNNKYTDVEEWLYSSRLDPKGTDIPWRRYDEACEVAGQKNETKRA